MMIANFIIMLEGQEAEKRYFISMEVTASDAESASLIAQKHAHQLGFLIISIEEVRIKEFIAFERASGVTKVSGRVFF